MRFSRKEDRHDDDRVGRLSSFVVVNFSRPELSPLLLGPLAKAAGGYGSCGDVFKDQTDPDYRQLLSAIRESKALFEAEPPFGTPGFRPNRPYVREMKRYGILPASFEATKDPLDIFQTDQKYWHSFWSQP